MNKELRELVEEINKAYETEIKMKAIEINLLEQAIENIKEITAIQKRLLNK